MEHKKTMTIEEIMAILPHRPPFLLIDRVVDTDNETYVEAVKSVTINEPFFTGHFPGHPIMPGVLIVEAMAQAAAIIVMKRPGHDKKIPYFMTIDEAKFRRPVTPGDVLKIRVEVLQMRARTGRAQAYASIDGTVVTEAKIGFILVDRTE